MVQGLTRDTSPEARVTWKVMDAAQFSGPDEVAHLVVEQKTWVAVVGMFAASRVMCFFS